MITCAKHINTHTHIPHTYTPKKKERRNEERKRRGKEGGREGRREVRICLKILTFKFINTSQSNFF